MLVHCLHCRHPKTVDDQRLQGLEGKTVKVPCKNCGEKFTFIVPTKQAEETGTMLVDGGSVRSGAHLIVQQSSHHSEQNFELLRTSTIIGRLSSKQQAVCPELGILTSDMHMSKLHCLIERNERGGRRRYVLSDYKSTNHTFLNDQQLENGEQVVLQDGDRITIGRTQLIFRLL